MSGAQIVFLVLAVMTVMAALGVVAYGSRPVWSAVCLVVNFFLLGLLYFTMGAQFLGITQIMVYAGAIMVLFLFVIMILKLGSGDGKEEEKNPLVRYGAVLGGLFVVLLIGGTVIYPISTLPVETASTPEFAEKLGKPQAIGFELFSNYVWPFEVASVLLLVGVVGSILLAKRRFR